MEKNREKLSLADIYVPAYNGLSFSKGKELAGLSNAVVNFLAGNEGFEDNYRRGYNNFERQLENSRANHTVASALSELGGSVINGAALAKLLKSGYGVVNALKSGAKVVKKVYPKRTKEQIKQDRAYGKEEFLKLRDLSPLTREGHSPASVSAKSWEKISQYNIPEKYDMLHNVPDIYANGEYFGPIPAEHGHNNNFSQFHWFEKNNQGLQVGENNTGRILYNVNPDVKQFLLEHPDTARKILRMFINKNAPSIKEISRATGNFEKAGSDLDYKK